MMPVRDRRQAPFTTLVVALCAVAIGVGGCSLRGSGYQYVRSTEQGTYVKMPDDWLVFEFQKEQDDELTVFARGFDAARRPDGDRALFESKAPTGVVRVNALTFEQRDAISLKGARNGTFAIDEGLAAGTHKLVSDTVRVQGGFRGERIVFRVTAEEGELVVDQTTFLDAATTRMYTLIVTCTPECYEANRDEINTVADSFTLKET